MQLFRFSKLRISKLYISKSCISKLDVSKRCMSKNGFQKLHCLRGDMLIEAMIAMVLMATLVMGAAYITSKVSSSQRDMRLQEIAVNKMRTALLQHRMGLTDVCANFSIQLPTGEDVEIAKQGCNGNTAAMITATVNGKAITDFPQPIFLAARSDSLGTIVVGGTWPDPFRENTQ